MTIAAPGRNAAGAAPHTWPGGGDPFARRDPPALSLTLWPHRSLTRRGTTGVMGVTAAGLALPLLPFLGTSVAWGLLPFLAAPLFGLYWAIRRSFDDGRLSEELMLWPDLITVVRREPRGAIRRWHAHPNWVQARLREDARIEKYLTLRGNGREIELGAFLTPEERTDLYRDLTAALGQARASRTTSAETLFPQLAHD